MPPTDQSYIKTDWQGSLRDVDSNEKNKGRIQVEADKDNYRTFQNVIFFYIVIGVLT